MKLSRFNLLLSIFMLVLAGCTPADQAPAEPTSLPNGSVTETETETPPPPANTDPPGDYVDWVFYNGNILTMDNGIVAPAIAIKGDKIVAVGTNRNLREMSGPDTNQIDLEGRTLMPGFVDGHSHYFTHDWRGDLEGGQAHLLSIGITTIAELTRDEGLLQELTQMNADGKLRVRISFYPNHTDNCGAVQGEWYLPDYPVSREPGAMLQVPGVKMFNDGGSCGRPARSFPYPDGSLGELFFQPDELAQMVIQSQEKGYQVIIHALGDRAVEGVLDAIEMAKAVCIPDNAHNCRHRIEHNGLVRDDQLSRYSEVDPVAMIFGGFPACFFAGVTSQYSYSGPPEYLDWEWRWRSLMDANPDVHFAWHGDTPPMGDIHPMRHIHGFVTRNEVLADGTRCEAPDWALDDRLMVEEALNLMTAEGAYAVLREDELGTLTTGKLADLIILSENLLAIDPEEILDIQVLLTMVGGKAEHCVGEYADLCN